MAKWPHLSVENCRLLFSVLPFAGQGSLPQTPGSGPYVTLVRFCVALAQFLLTRASHPSLADWVNRELAGLRGPGDGLFRPLRHRIPPVNWLPNFVKNENQRGALTENPPNATIVRYVLNRDPMVSGRHPPLEWRVLRTPSLCQRRCAEHNPSDTKLRLLWGYDFRNFHDS